MKHRIMAHLVAGYPDEEGSLEAARALIDGGASIIEVQFPFSDPSADGPLIQEACTTALERGFTVQRGYSLLEKIKAYRDLPLFVMSYAGPVFAKGISNFLKQIKDRGAGGIIVPDLMPGCDEGLYAEGDTLGLPVIPVITPYIGKEREKTIMATHPEYVYVALRTGITGSRTALDEERLDFLKRVGTYKTAEGSSVRIMAGFGIKENKQIELLAPHIYASIIGSAFVGRIRELDNQNIPIYEGLKSFTEDLCTIRR
jgi:tryptophan synthase alpha chain